MLVRAAPMLACATLVALGSPGGAQSNVRPSPGVARVPAIGARYFAGPGVADPWTRPLTARPEESFATPWEALDDLPVERRPRRFTRLELRGISLAGERFEDGVGELATVRGGWKATVGERVGEEVVLAVDLEAEASFYDFSNAGNLGAGAADPFNDVYQTRLGLSLMQDPRARTSWFSGAELRVSGEDDADLSDSLAVGVVGGVRHDVDPDLSMSLGIAALSRLEDDPWILPYLGFDWRVADRLWLYSEGTRVGARAELGDTLELSLGAEYAIRQFRLNDDAPLPAGVVQDEEVLAALALSWSPSSRCTLAVEGGVALWRELQSYDAAGTRLAELEVEPTELVSVSLSATF